MSSLHTALQSLDPDHSAELAFAVSVAVQENELELPMHRHLKGQLVVALQGGVMCRAEGGLWMVPSRSGMWIPGGSHHSNHVTPNGRICLLFVDPSVKGMPSRCCTLALNAMLIEMITHMSAGPETVNPRDSHYQMIGQVVLEEIRRMEVTDLHLPIPNDPTLTKIANALIEHPADRSTLAEWAGRVAMSERSLTRHVQRKTAMSFGRWRQQLHLVIAMQRLSGGASVQNVSEDLGYESVSAFITMFKTALGKSPARYIADRVKVASQ